VRRAAKRKTLFIIISLIFGGRLQRLSAGAWHFGQATSIAGSRGQV
jgi:hypothetical protein